MNQKNIRRIRNLRPILAQQTFVQKPSSLLMAKNKTPLDSRIDFTLKMKGGKNTLGVVLSKGKPNFFSSKMENVREMAPFRRSEDFPFL